MSERILIPLDGSKVGETALSYVKGMIDKLGPGESVEITLFHVITAVRHVLRLQGGTAISVPYNEDELAVMKNETMDYLNRVGDSLRSDNVTIQCKVSVSENPVEDIIKAEQEVNADLVAMSTHGRGGISRFTLGSVADKVMRGGSVPVLMVRASI